MAKMPSLNLAIKEKNFWLKNRYFKKTPNYFFKNKETIVPSEEILTDNLS